MSHPRVLVLENGNPYVDHPSRYLTELSRIGLDVITCTSPEELLNALALQEVIAVVIDGFSLNAWRQIVQHVRRRFPHGPPMIFVTVRDEADHTPDEWREIFIAEKSGPRDTLRVILGRDLRSLHARLLDLKATAAHDNRPPILFKHGRNKGNPGAFAPRLYREWLRQTGCVSGERLIDMVLPGGLSYLEVGRALPDAARRRDMYVMDRLARTSVWGGRFTIGQLADALSEDSVFGEELERLSDKGWSHWMLYNCIKRLRQSMTAVGLDGRAVLRHLDDAYDIDLRLVRVSVLHVPD